MVIKLGKRKVLTSCRAGLARDIGSRRWTWELLPRLVLLRLGTVYSVKAGLGPWLVSFSWIMVTRG